MAYRRILADVDSETRGQSILGIQEAAMYRAVKAAVTHVANELLQVFYGERRNDAKDAAQKGFMVGALRADSRNTADGITRFMSSGNS